MSKISRKRRKFQIRLRQKRRQKLKKLKEKYLTAKTEVERKNILEKIQKISPYFEISDLK